MNLPTNFQFSQSSLQDFDICPRRFRLRYLDRLRWPAIQSEPVAEVERLSQLGADFHRLVHQHLLGLDPALLAETAAQSAPELRIWWQNYLTHRPPQLDAAACYPELLLSAPLRGHRLLARFDVLARQPDGAFLIIDWKTSQRQPPRGVLARSMQTRVYPYVLARAGTALNQGQPIDPAAITMLYWFPAFPAEPEEFSYNHELLQQNEELLSNLIEQIKDAARRRHFPLVADDSPCRFCVYRSYCERQVPPGEVTELTEIPAADIDPLALDWDQIAEIQF